MQVFGMGTAGPAGSREVAEMGSQAQGEPAALAATRGRIVWQGSAQVDERPFV